MADGLDDWGALILEWWKHMQWWHDGPSGVWLLMAVTGLEEMEYHKQDIK